MPFEIVLERESVLAEQATESLPLRVVCVLMSISVPRSSKSHSTLGALLGLLTFPPLTATME